MTQRPDSKQDVEKGGASCRTMVKTIGKIHHLDLSRKAFCSGVGRSLPHRSQAVSLIVSRAGSQRMLHSVLWISLERQRLPRNCLEGCVEDPNSSLSPLELSRQ